MYAIPYEGEEVTLHWANKDQYYIKTSEYLRDYAFRLRPDDAKKPMRVHFRLVDVAEGEHGNVKAAEGKERRFELAPGNAVSVEDGELVVRFTYQPATAKQKDLNAANEQALLAANDSALTEWIAELAKPNVRADGTSSGTRLRLHLDRYAARNTFDYFIHKDLGGFLRRELDFYIKNEVMHLDDVENETAPRVEQYLSKIKVIRRIAGKIIDFLAQLEDFQKELWLKKKFVVETQWCITLGCIPEAFYAEIAANDEQHREWVSLFSIDEIGSDLIAPDYSKKSKPEFLKAHLTLVVDTRHFDADFTARLLEAIGDVDEQTDGVLFHSENSQALSLMRARHRDRINCIYIDPPYNTGNDGFTFKDNYQHSSWLSMIEDRLIRMGHLASSEGVIFASVDDNEVMHLKQIMASLFGDDAFEAQVVVQSNKRGQTYQAIAKTHEYLLAFHLGADARVGELRRDVPSDADRDLLGPYELWELRNRNPKFGRHNRPNLFFPIYLAPSRAGSDGFAPASLDHSLEFAVEVLPRNSAGGDSCWRWGQGKVRLATAGGCLDVLVGKAKRDGGWSVFQKSRKSSTKAKTIWDDTDVINEQGTVQLGNLGLAIFVFPKPVGLVAKVLEMACSETETVLDFFAGSGTTAHAVVSVNREDGGRRKFILVEMGDYFDTVLLPRIKKVTFTPEWKDGKPKRLATPEEAERSPRIVKVVRLESYEDALNNLEARRTDTQQLLLDTAEAKRTDGLKEQYLLRYMLDVETRGSQSLLNVQAFTDPTAYKLKVKRPGSDESREVDVDLLETFNWLIGLTVKHIAAPQTFIAAFERDSEKRLCLKGRLKQEADGPYWFRTITGTTPDGRKALIIWRKLTGEPEQDNLVLDSWFTKQGYSAKDSEFDLIYVNGGNNLENLKTAEDIWKVRLIDEDFHRLMFDAEGAQT